MRRPPPLPLRGPAGLMALLALLTLGSGGVLVANEIAAREGERSGFAFFNTQGERFEEVVTVRSDDNAGTSLAFSALAYPEDGSARTVTIGRDDVFADNLAAGLLQSQGPLLLTDGRRLNADVRDEVLRLQPEQVYVVGGPKAVSPEVEGELRSLGLPVTRLSGPTRVETALAIARHAAPRSATAVLVRARDEAGGDGSRAWADSLAAGAFAAASGVPVLLTDSAALHPGVASYLAAAEVKDAYVIGGRAAIQDGVLADVRGRGMAATRVAGAERADTAVRVAQDLWGFTGSEVAEQIVLVDGFADNSWAAGVAAAAFAARFRAPIVLADGSTVPPATERWIARGGARMVCGDSVRDEACRQAATGSPATSSPSPVATPTASPTPSHTPGPPPTIVHLSDSRHGRALFQVSDLLPGQEHTRDILVRNTGNVTLDVRLHGLVAPRTTADLAAVLELRIRRVTEEGHEVVFPAGGGTSTLRAFGQAHPDYASGVDEWTARPGDSRRYEVRLRLPETHELPAPPDDVRPGWSAEVTFSWEGSGG